MELSFLGEEIFTALKPLDYRKLYEIRLRIGFPVKIYYNDKFDYLFLSENNVKRKVYCTEKMILDAIFCLTEGSLYAYNDEIKDGFIAYGGQRIGISGEFVYMDGKIKTVLYFVVISIKRTFG